MNETSKPSQLNPTDSQQPEPEPAPVPAPEAVAEREKWPVTARRQ